MIEGIDGPGDWVHDTRLHSLAPWGLMQIIMRDEVHVHQWSLPIRYGGKAERSENACSHVSDLLAHTSFTWTPLSVEDQHKAGGLTFLRACDGYTTGSKAVEQPQS